MEMQELENIRDIYFFILKRKQNSFRNFFNHGYDLFESSLDMLV